MVRHMVRVLLPLARPRVAPETLSRGHSASLSGASRAGQKDCPAPEERELWRSSRA